MAKVLNSITFDAPAAPLDAALNDTFAFSGTPSFSGGGGVQNYDWKWEVDDGGGFVTIAASGTGLITADTNPLTNTKSQNQNSINVTCDQAGSYTIRMAGAPSTGGSYTVLSSTQTVTVAAATPFSADLSAASFAITPQAQTRLNAFAAVLSAPAFGFTAQALTRLNAWAGQLSAASFGFLGRALTWSGAAPFVAELTAPAMAMSAQALTRLNAWRADLSAPSFAMLGQAVSRFSDYVVQCSAAAMQMQARSLTISSQEEGEDVLPNWRIEESKERLRILRLTGPGQGP